MYREEKERKEAARIGYTEYNLPMQIMMSLYMTLDIYPPEFREEGDFFIALEKYEYSLKKKDLKLEAGDKTEEILKKLNDFMFNDPLGGDLREAATVYGFSEKNPITLEWILTHPWEMYSIICADRPAFNDFR